MRVHIIQQDEWVTPGEYLAWAQRRGWDVSWTRCWLYESIPEQPEADMLVILGGRQSPDTTKAECDYFDSPAEQRLIREYIAIHAEKKHTVMFVIGWALSMAPLLLMIR